MSDFYFALVLYNPISTADHLHKVRMSLGEGFVIPFDSKNPDFNNYIYVSCDVYERDDWRRKVSSLCGDFDEFCNKIPRSQIDRFIDNVGVSNDLKVGDFVKSPKIWKSLPLEIKEIEGDKARVFHELRGESLDEWVSIEDLQIDENRDDSQIYKIKRFVEDREYSLVIDCDSFEGNDIVTLKNFLTTLLRIKLYYPRHKVIIMNPCDSILSISNPMGLQSCFGSIFYFCKRENKKSDVVIYSNSLLLRSLFSNIVFKDGDSVFENWDYPNRDRDLDLVKGCMIIESKNMISESKLNRDSHLMAHKMRGDMGRVRLEVDKFISLRSMEEPFSVMYDLNTEELYSEFEKRGLSYFGDGIYSFIDLLRG